MVCQFPISANSGNPVSATNHRTSFQQKMRKYYQLWMWMGFPLSVLCSGNPMYTDKPPILAQAIDTSFLRVKEQVPLNLKIKCQWFNVKWSSVDWDRFWPLLNLAGLHIPLKPGIEPTAQESETVVFTRARSVIRPFDQVKRTYYLGEFHRC